MVSAFQTDNPDLFPAEDVKWRGNIKKLGRVQSYYFEHLDLHVCNMYTQYNYGTDSRKLNYGALSSCLSHLRDNFAGQKIALPWIGCGLAGGSKEIVGEMIEFYLPTCTIIEYELS
jgi:hypothetical protein